MEFRSESGYKIAREKLNEHYAAVREYLTANRTNAVPSDVARTFPHSDTITNELRSAVEVWEFSANPPDKYFLYINESDNSATTWTGQKLGDVVKRDPYYSNFGDVRVPIKVFTADKRCYYGTYYKSAGDYARVRLRKHQD